jgi:hypothetical protein
MCEVCWEKERGDQRPVRVVDAEEERCCWCGSLTTSGIYYREDPMQTPKHRVGDHDD